METWSRSESILVTTTTNLPEERLLFWDGRNRSGHHGLVKAYIGCVDVKELLETGQDASALRIRKKHWNRYCGLVYQSPSYGWHAEEGVLPECSREKDEGKTKEMRRGRREQQKQQEKREMVEDMNAELMEKSLAS